MQRRGRNPGDATGDAGDARGRDILRRMGIYMFANAKDLGEG
jgi:hypothetical protein